MEGMDKNKKEEEGEFDWDLPIEGGAKVVKPRIHISEGTCLNCEG
jgi:hypothetical protein